MKSERRLWHWPEHTGFGRFLITRVCIIERVRSFPMQSADLRGRGIIVGRTSSSGSMHFYTPGTKNKSSQISCKVNRKTDRIIHTKIPFPHFGRFFRRMTNIALFCVRIHIRGVSSLCMRNVVSSMAGK